jgi:crossover junction endodeoxyribonuclease RuvC
VKILGIDPGFGIMGWAVIETGERLIDFGVITTSANQTIDERILVIHRSLDGIIHTHCPEVAAIEKLFFTKNIKTGIDVAKTIGAIILTLKLNNIHYSEYTPSQVKQAITGYARADKKQMKDMVKKIFKLPAPPEPDDAADALAIALCHSFRRRTHA